MRNNSSVTDSFACLERDRLRHVDGTLQFRWIVMLEGGVAAQFADDENVFVAGDLLWYPVQGHPEICAAPDTMVVFGRTKRDRGSYLQWREGDIAPQVVFEVKSPNNRPLDLEFKRDWYDEYGVEEYYLIDPEPQTLEGWVRREGRLVAIENPNGWISPRLGIRFEIAEGKLRIFGADGVPFQFYGTLHESERAAQQEAERERERHARKRTETLRRRAEEEKVRAEEEKVQAEAEKVRAESDRDAAQRRAELLAAKVREMGLNPDEI